MKSALLEPPLFYFQKQEKFIYPPLPKQFKNIRELDIKHCVKEENSIIDTFQKLLAKIQKETPINIKILVIYTLQSISPQIFKEFINSDLFSHVLDNFIDIFNPSKLEYLELDDKTIYEFLYKNIKGVSVCFNDQSIKKLCQRISEKNHLVNSKHTINAIKYAFDFHLWVSDPEKSTSVLSLFFKPIRFSFKIELLPLPLVSEIARCFVIAALVFPKLENDDPVSISNNIAICLLRILQYAPKSFENASIRRCLELVHYDNPISPSLWKLRSALHYKNLLRCTLELIILTLNIDHMDEKQDLINAASVSDTVKVCVIKSHNPLFEDDIDAKEYLSSVSMPQDITDTTCTFSKVPDSLSDLSVFLSSRGVDKNLQKTARTRKLGFILNKVNNALNSLTFPSCDYDTLIECMNIMLSFINIPAFSEEMPSLRSTISSCYIYLICKIVDAVVASPLYPHKDSDFDNVESINLYITLSELGRALLPHFLVFFDFILSTQPTPQRVQLLYWFLVNKNENMRKDDQVLKRINDFIYANFLSIEVYILKILKVPSEIGSIIAADCYMQLFNSVYIYKKLSVMKPFLQMQLEMISKLAERAFGSDKNTIENGFYHTLTFLENIAKHPYIKSYFLMCSTVSFNGLFTNWLKPDMVHKYPKVAARIFKILSHLCDFGNTCCGGVPGAQRLVTDCLAHPILEIVLKYVVEYDFDSLFLEEKTDLAFAILEFLLALCDPTPVVTFMMAIIDQQIPNNLRDLIFERGDETMSQIANQLAIDINKSITAAKSKECPVSIDKVQSIFQKEGGDLVICSIFFQLIGVKDVEFE